MSLLHLDLFKVDDVRLGFFKFNHQVLLFITLLLKHTLRRVELVLCLHQLLLHRVQVKNHVIDGLDLREGPLTHYVMAMCADRQDSLAFPGLQLLICSWTPG